MKKFLTIMVAIFSLYSFSYSGQKDIIEKADLLLDIMEYESAVVNYLKALSKNPQQRNIRKEIGYAYYQLEKVDDALSYLKEELNLFPDNGDAYDFLVYILYKLNKLHEANNFLERFDFPIRLTEENPHIGGLACFILGMYYKELKRYGKAENHFRKALEKKYDPVKCYVQLIDAELIRNDVRFARRILESEAYATCGLRPEFYFMFGLINFEEAKSNVNRIPRAIGFFKAAAKSKSDFIDALFNVACIYYNVKDFKNAVDYFEKILEREPGNTKVKFYLDCTLKKLKKSVDKESISECPKMIELSREFIDKPDMGYKYQFKHDIVFVLHKINKLALAFIKKDKMYQAIERFDNGIKIYPESPEINYNLGMVYYMQNNYKEAEKHALIALRRKGFFTVPPDDLMDYEIRRLIKKKKDPLHEAPDIPLSKWTFNVALKEGNYFLEAYDLLGNVYFKKGNFNRSILAFKKDVEIDHEDAWGHYNLGCAYSALNEQENAEKEWKKAIKYERELKEKKDRREISEDELEISLIVLKRPISFRAHKSLGWLYLDKKLVDKALKEFEKALKLEPDDPEPYYDIGKIYEAKSEFNEKYVRKAIYYYERYLYLGGEKEEEVKKLLKSLK